jgi:hypothetical protein
VERRFKTALNQPLSNQLYRSGSTGERLGDPLVGPLRPIGIGLQQNLGTPNFWARPLQLLDNASKLIALLIRQSHDINLLHGTPPYATQNR